MDCWSVLEIVKNHWPLWREIGIMKRRFLLGIFPPGNRTWWFSLHVFQPVIEALGNKYHDRCFRCAQCSNRVPDNFHAENGQPYCDDCHQKRRSKTAPVCDVCSSAITQGTRIEALGKVWHENCFHEAAWGPCDQCHAKVLLTEVKKQNRNRWIQKWTIKLSIDRMIDWLIDWSIDWSIDWLIDWLVDWLIDWLVDWLLVYSYKIVVQR